jgi:hypothetical protein
MWIELPAIAFWEEVNGRMSDAEADTNIGYLIWDGVVRVASWSDRVDQGAGILPIEYLLNHPLTLEQEWELCKGMGIHRAVLHAFYWGESFMKLVADGLSKHDDKAEAPPVERAKHLVNQASEEELGSVVSASLALRDNVGIRPTAMPPEFDKWEILREVLARSSGDMRNIIALLLFLNRTSDVQIVDDVPAARGFIRNKQATYFRHSVVRMKLTRRRAC